MTHSNKRLHCKFVSSDSLIVYDTFAPTTAEVISSDEDPFLEISVRVNFQILYPPNELGYLQFLAFLKQATRYLNIGHVIKLSNCHRGHANLVDERGRATKQRKKEKKFTIRLTPLD